jgi:hypothetical protein
VLSVAETRQDPYDSTEAWREGHVRQPAQRHPGHRPALRPPQPSLTSTAIQTTSWPPARGKIPRYGRSRPAERSSFIAHRTAATRALLPRPSVTRRTLGQTDSLAPDSGTGRLPWSWFGPVPRRRGRPSPGSPSARLYRIGLGGQGGTLIGRDRSWAAA